MDDFEFTCQLFSKLFSQKRIQNTLNSICELDITGWEKWWQVEMAIYIDNHNDIAEWGIEEDFLIDKRSKGKQKNKIAIDLSYRRKNYSKDKFIYVELKQADETTTCIRNMCSDLDKVYTARKKSQYGSEIRDFYLVGVHLRDSTKGAVKQLVNLHLEDRNTYLYEFFVDEDTIEVSVIPSTEYYYTIF